MPGILTELLAEPAGVENSVGSSMMLSSLPFTDRPPMLIRGERKELEGDACLEWLGVDIGEIEEERLVTCRDRGPLWCSSNLPVEEEAKEEEVRLPFKEGFLILDLSKSSRSLS